MLHLDARIHFDEIPLTRIRIHQEFHGPRVVIPRRPRQLHRRLGQLPPHPIVQAHRRRYLDHLLMPPLHRAIPLIKVQQVPRAIPQDLHLHMPRPLHVTFQEHRIVAKRRARLPPRLRQPLAEFRRAAHHPHAAPAAAERRLHDQRKPYAPCHPLRLPRIADRILCPRHRRNARPLRQLPRRPLVAQQLQQLRARPDKRNPRPLASARQRRILRQKSVPRMDRVHALFPRQPDNPVHIEVRLHRPLSRADQVRLIRLETVQRQPVLLRIDRNRPQPQLIGRAQNPYGNLTPVKC